MMTGALKDPSSHYTNPFRDGSRVLIKEPQAGVPGTAQGRDCTARLYDDPSVNEVSTIFFPFSYLAHYVFGHHSSWHMRI